MRSANSAMQPIKVAFTVDAENPQTPLYQKAFSDNRLLAAGHAVPALLELFSQAGIRASIFLNVYEYPLWGKREMAGLVRRIHAAGQDVELHTHPIWIDPQRREHMHQFSELEQQNIIAWGRDFIGDSCGRPPLAHRAGAYAYNHDTLAACLANGIAVDSSNFFGHPNCRAVLTRNRVVEKDGLVEAPVTFFIKNNAMAKTDLDILSIEDILAFCEDPKQCEGFVNVFMHSYSLLRHSPDFAVFQPDPAKKEKLLKLIKAFQGDPRYSIASLAEHFAPQLADSKPESRQAAPSLVSEIRLPDLGDRPEDFKKHQPLGKDAVSKLLQAASKSLKQGERVLVFCADVPALGKLPLTGFSGSAISLAAVHQEVAKAAQERGFKAFTPLDYDYTYFFYNSPFHERGAIENKYHYSKGKYQETFNQVFVKTLAANPALGQIDGFDLYVNGDYNASYDVGASLLYPIDVVDAIISAQKPAMVLLFYTPQMDDIGLELILERYLMSRPPAFHKFEVA